MAPKATTKAEPEAESASADADATDATDDESSSSEESVDFESFLITRERRANAGGRMQDLLNQEIEAEEIFEEEEDDVEFENKEEKDVFDSDFDSTDEDADAASGDESEGEGKTKRRKRVAFVPAFATQRKNPHSKKTPAAASAGAAASAARPAAVPRPKRETSTRKSAVAFKAALEERQRAAVPAVKRVAPKKREKPELTQADLIAEALETEEKNKASLIAFYEMEEERRERDRLRHARLEITEPKITVVSRRVTERKYVRRSPPPADEKPAKKLKVRDGRGLPSIHIDIKSATQPGVASSGGVVREVDVNLSLPGEGVVLGETKEEAQPSVPSSDKMPVPSSDKREETLQISEEAPVRAEEPPHQTVALTKKGKGKGKNTKGKAAKGKKTPATSEMSTPVPPEGGVSASESAPALLSEGQSESKPDLGELTAADEAVAGASGLDSVAIQPSEAATLQNETTPHPSNPTPAPENGHGPIPDSITGSISATPGEGTPMVKSDEQTSDSQVTGTPALTEGTATPAALSGSTPLANGTGLIKKEPTDEGETKGQPAEDDPEEMEDVARTYVIIDAPISNRKQLLETYLGNHHEWGSVKIVPSRSRVLNRRTATCPLTGLTALYCDPDTHVPFANAEAYRRLRTLVESKDHFVYDPALEAYRGTANIGIEVDMVPQVATQTSAANSARKRKSARV